MSFLVILIKISKAISDIRKNAARTRIAILRLYCPPTKPSGMHKSKIPIGLIKLVISKIMVGMEIIQISKIIFEYFPR